jgi:putative multicomponent Na+:H+ antiporter subunit B
MDSYIYLITALLPLAAAMVVFQTNPYHALVIRGILGAVAALIYTVLGAADVALTEALVGTLLAITLYAVAVRSSLVFRLGVLKSDLYEATTSEQSSPFQCIVDELNTVFDQHYMRVELVPYMYPEDLHHALIEKDIHATCMPQSVQGQAIASEPQYQTQTRLRRLYDILHSELSASNTHVSYIHPDDLKIQTEVALETREEVQS